jgi:hypothetical protein
MSALYAMRYLGQTGIGAGASSFFWHAVMNA